MQGSWGALDVSVWVNMNVKDIEAAKRLIAQFEDRATGRHNSHESWRAPAMGLEIPPQCTFEIPVHAEVGSLYWDMNNSKMWVMMPTGWKDLEEYSPAIPS